MVIKVKQCNAWSASNELKDEIKSLGKPEVGIKVWNRYNPEESECWVIPVKSADVAYNYGKILFKKKDDNQMFCGFNFEKGLDPITKYVWTSSKGKRWIMDKSWIWHRFIDDMRSGELRKKVAAVVIHP